MDSNIIPNKPDLNTWQCHGVVYKLSMSTRHINSTIFPIMYLPDLLLAIFQWYQQDRRSTARIIVYENETSANTMTLIKLFKSKTSYLYVSFVV